MSNQFSQEVSIFRGRRLAEKGFVVGNAKLLEIIENETSKQIPLPDILSMCTDKHKRYASEEWEVYTKRHKPDQDIRSHIIFALKYEAIDILILKETFKLLGAQKVIDIIQLEPTGQYARRIWFLYEWLFGERLETPDLKTGTYVPIVNETLQYAIKGTNSTRHRVINNLPGNVNYCPMIRRTEKLDNYLGLQLNKKIEEGFEGINNELIRRTAAFLLLKDSKASFNIEGEKPSNSRARNWGYIIRDAGKQEITTEEIERLQQIVIGRDKLKHMGIRVDHEGFIGEHDIEDFTPIPSHISAKSSDLPKLIDGLLETNRILQENGYHPAFIASSIAFGFVYIHPLADGNGRIHRFLIHHILAKTEFASRNMIFPISAAILDDISSYEQVLEAHSLPRLELIDWESTEDHNTKILNDTLDLYRYFDITKETEFLFDCINDTIVRIIPAELDYLRKYDRLTVKINNILVMENTRIDLLIKMLHQNEGRLSKKKYEKFFSDVEAEKIVTIELLFDEVFNGSDED